MYTVEDYPTKAALKRALAAGVAVEVYQPGGIFPGRGNGRITLEGPHFPRPHTWYAACEVRDFIIVPGTLR